MDAAEATEGFDERFGELFDLAMRPAMRMLRDRQEAENIAAEVLARALVRWNSLRSSPTLPGWVVTVSTNLTIQHLRKVGRRQFLRLPVVAPDQPSIDDRLDLSEALLGLSKRQREAIALRYFLDLEEADVAGALGISVSSVKTHLQRGLVALRRSLTESPEATVAVE